jgi:hypothetical protein
VNYVKNVLWSRDPAGSAPPRFTCQGCMKKNNSRNDFRKTFIIALGNYPFGE